MEDETHGGEFFLFLNSGFQEFNTREILSQFSKQVEINAIKFEEKQMHFNDVVFAAVPILVAKAPYESLEQARKTHCCPWYHLLFILFQSHFLSTGSNDSTTNNLNNRESRQYGSATRPRPTQGETVVYSFEFEDCVLAAYRSQPVECTVHGRLELRELAPDAVSISSLALCQI